MYSQLSDDVSSSMNLYLKTKGAEFLTSAFGTLIFDSNLQSRLCYVFNDDYFELKFKNIEMGSSLEQDPHCFNCISL